MNKIFEGAKFGDKFKTRDGRMAIYVKHIDGVLKPNLLLVDGDGEIAVSNEGLVWAKHPDIEVSNDIVGRWDESIDEEDLIELVNDCWESNKYEGDEVVKIVAISKHYVLAEAERLIVEGELPCYSKESTSDAYFKGYIKGVESIVNPLGLKVVLID